MEKPQSEIVAEYYNQYKQDLLRIAYAMLHDTFEAEVAVQETFTTALMKSEDFIKSENPIGWLCKTLRYKVLQLYRERALVNATLSYAEETSGTGKEDKYSLFLEYRGLIPDEQLSLLIDFHSGNYSCEELAKKYGKTLTNIRVSLSRSRAKFREQFLKEIEK